MCFKLEETAHGSALVYLFSYYVVKTCLCVAKQLVWGVFMKFSFSRVLLKVIFGGECSGLNSVNKFCKWESFCRNKAVMFVHRCKTVILELFDNRRPC